MTEKQQYQSLIAQTIKNLIAYGKTDDIMTKTIIVNTYDESEDIDSLSVAAGDASVLGHMALHTLQTLPEEVIIHILAHLVQDYPDAIADLLELYQDGELGDEE
jgi:hypothetical protein